MKNLFSKFMTALLAVAVLFAAFPVTSAFAADENPPQQPTDERLEKAWARELKIYERIGKAFQDTDAHITRIQDRIDKAAESGKDVTALQAALDAYSTALTATQPKYEALGQVFRTHSGFDANGKVTDSEKAWATVKEAREQLKAIKESMGGTFKALREAMKAFREANKPAEGTERDS